MSISLLFLFPDMKEGEEIELRDMRGEVKNEEEEEEKSLLMKKEDASGDMPMPVWRIPRYH